MLLCEYVNPPTLVSGNCSTRPLVASYCAERRKRRRPLRPPEDHEDSHRRLGNEGIALKMRTTRIVNQMPNKRQFFRVSSTRHRAYLVKVLYSPWVSSRNRRLHCNHCRHLLEWSTSILVCWVCLPTSLWMGCLHWTRSHFVDCNKNENNIN